MGQGLETTKIVLGGIAIFSMLGYGIFLFFLKNYLGLGLILVGGVLMYFINKHIKFLLDEGFY